MTQICDACKILVTIPLHTGEVKALMLKLKAVLFDLIGTLLDFGDGRIRFLRELVPLVDRWMGL